MKLVLALVSLAASFASAQTDLTLARDKNWLVIQGAHLPNGEIRINYLEAYCRTVKDGVVVEHTGETKHIRGKIYLTPNDVPALLARYAKDFPEQTGK